MDEEPLKPKIFEPAVTNYPPLERPSIPGHTLVRCIGSGSYGEVWLAKDTAGLWRAIKVVHRQTFRNDKPFEREYTGILKFEPVSRTHEGLVDMIQVGRDNENRFFYCVMELADDAGSDSGGEIQPDRYRSKTLHHVLEEKKKLTFKESLNLAMGLASALGHLHSNGLIHRDIKPSNIIFVKGLPKLADIGLVAEVSDAKSFVGTEGYIPPEGPGTPTADLYSLGKVLYEMTTGLDRKKFPELPADFHLRPDHSGLVELNEIVVTACATQAIDRYQGVSEMTVDLALLQDGRSVRQVRNMSKRLAKAKKLGVIATVVALVLAVGWIFTEMQARRAIRAEQVASGLLYESLLAQSKFGRLSGVPGHRIDTLGAIQRAARIRPSLELRTEAIGAMALPDIEETQWFRPAPMEHPMYAAFSPDFDLYAVYDPNGKLNVLNRTNDTLIHSLDGVGTKGSLQRFSRSGRYLGSIGGNYRLLLWDLGGGTPAEVVRFEPPIRSMTTAQIRFSPDDQLALFLVREKGHITTIYPYELPSGNALPVMRWQGESAVDMEFSPDGTRLAVAINDRMEIYSWPERELQSVIQSPQDISCLAWHPSGQRIAGGNSGREVYLWTLGHEQPLILLAHSQYVSNVRFNHRGNLLVSSSWDGSTRFWDAATGKHLFSTQSGLALEFSKDDSELAFVQEDRGLGIWAMHHPIGLQRLILERTEVSPVIALDVSQDGRWLATGHRRSLRMWDINTSRQVWKKELGEHVRSVHFTPEDVFAVTCSSLGITKWPLRIENDVLRLAEPRNGMVVTSTPWFRSTLSKDGSYAGAVNGHRAKLYPLHDSLPKIVLESNQVELKTTAFVDGHRWLVGSDRYGQATVVWDTDTGKIVRKLGDFYAELAPSPDETALVTGAAREVVVWDTSNWKKRVSIPLQQGSSAFIPVVVTPDNQTVAAALDRRSVYLLDIDTGQTNAILSSPENKYINQLEFGPDARFLAAATDDYEILVWHLDVIRKELAEMDLDW